MKAVIFFAILAHVYAVEIGVPHTLQHVKQLSPNNQHLIEQHIGHVLQHVPQVKQHLKQQQEVVKKVEPVVLQQQQPQQELPEHIKNNINKHINHIITHVTEHRVPQQVLAEHLATSKVVRDVPQQQELPERIRNNINKHINHIVTHVTEHRVPQQVLAQHLAGSKLDQQVPQKVAQHVSVADLHLSPVRKVPQVPSNIQHIVEHAHQHIPQVINHHVNSQKVPVVGVPQVPSRVQQIVEHAHQHIPQVINHHIANQKVPKVPVAVGAEVPRVIRYKVTVQRTPVGVKVSQVPQNVQQIVQQAHQHIPQVINQHLSNQKVPVVNVPVTKVDDPVVPAIPSRVQQIVEHAHHHIPQVINHHISSQKVTPVQQVPQTVNPQVDVQQRTARAVMVVPEHVQNVVQHVHQHIPNIINHHIQQQQHQTKKCEFACTRLDMSICATNGKCWKQFEGHCALSKWNCQNNSKTFRPVDDAECEDSGKPRCYPGDM